MAARWILGLLSALAFVVGLVYHVTIATIVGLLGLLGALVVRPGVNPLTVAYRDVRPVDRGRDW